MNTQQRGFTLIELVIVIIILGILSATAVPRFLNLADDADIAVVEGTAGALKSAVNLAHSKWIIMGSATDRESNDNVQLYGSGPEGQIDFNTSGWPAQSYYYPDGKIITDNKEDCVSLWNTILNTGSDKIDETTTSEPFFVQYSQADPGVCVYKWSDNDKLYIRYDSNNGDVMTQP
ncbi:Pilin, putative [Moritella viscosa]|uniref:Pilin, putative n=1 Tax=Moritella viscosa TaxID=80854 RepID=A0A090K7H0_9GAMM|nr:prepilin-type N-terminal cleavage/methylation domain-containing protein [Moritella viscosa]CED59758.1 putative pilin [Moritella viscosa]SGY90021.1 Pilin, putative [Moritella viscosa]SGY90041.1 Pilin, putative [Moritella viscosa]SGZ16583.1 Pilin, putative [Moritella viscosa]SHO02262.1 Pilin, putative [Moritella viscosa]